MPILQRTYEFRDAPSGFDYVTEMLRTEDNVKWADEEDTRKGEGGGGDLMYQNSPTGAVRWTESGISISDT